MKHKKVRLGFVVVDTRTGDFVSAIFKQHDQADAIAKALYGDHDLNVVDVLPVEAHVPDGWKPGDSLEGCVDEKVLRRLEHTPKAARSAEPSRTRDHETMARH